MSSLCRCGSRRERRVAGPSSSYPGRPYFSCSDCRAFDWADQRSTTSSYASAETGPNCDCGKVTVQRSVKKAGPNQGRRFWSCATWPRGCKFFEWKQDDSNTGAGSPTATAAKTSPSPSVSPSPPKRKRAPLPGHASYFTDWNKTRLLQEIMNVGVDHKKLNEGSSGTYDSFEVVGAWHISNPSRMERYENAKQRERAKTTTSPTPVPDQPLNDLPEDYARITTELGQDALDTKAGEVFLLHGTAPENLHKILFEGLDPEVSRNGKFGRGVYFAENAAKINEYATLDKMFDKSGPLAELHTGLYKSSMHPKRVRYCLVSRVVLGRHVVRTNNGTTQLSSSSSGETPFFSYANRSQLSPIENDDNTTVQPSSLVAECGDRNPSFREFVVFHPDQIFVEYVVAYHCVRRYCDCNEPIVKRTVTKPGVNRGREIHFCNNRSNKNDESSSSPRSCGYMRMLPLCDCGQSATVKTSHSAKNPGRQYYTCHGRNCDYFGWCGETSTHGTTASPYKKQRN